MTRHFTRPVFVVSLHASKQNLVLLRTKYYVIAKHRFAVLWQSPGRAPCYKTHARYCIMGPNGILCTRWEKEYASVRQTFVACDDCLVKNEAYDAEKKAHASKRVSIIAYNNVISKAQCAPRRHKLPYGTFAAQRH